MGMEAKIDELTKSVVKIETVVMGNGYSIFDYIESIDKKTDKIAKRLSGNDTKTAKLCSVMTDYIKNHPRNCPYIDEEKRADKKERKWKLWIIRGTVGSTFLGMIFLILTSTGVL